MFSYKSSTKHTQILVLVLLLIALTPNSAHAVSLQGVNEVAQQVVWWMISSFFGFLVYLTGSALDISIDKFIVQFGGLFRTSGLGAAVNNLWTVVRDIFNLFFIFGLIYAGFRLIIFSDEGGVKKTIANLVIAALLINFSLFITKTIIDFSNIISVQVAQVLYSSAPSDRSISGAFLQNMGATGLFAPNGTGTARAAGAQAPGWIYIFSAMFLLIVAAFAFAAGAVLICIRFVMLNYYMVISPVMFLDKIVPKFSSYTSNFWSDFLKNAFFAPAFLLMLYFSLYILGSMYSFLTVAGGGGARPSLYDAFATPEGSVSGITTVIMFLLAAGFLIASVIIAQKMGAVGSKMALSIGNDLRNRGQKMIGGATFGAAARLGQRTIGRHANKLADSDWMKDKAARSSLGALAFRASKAIGDKSFDGRHILKSAGVKELGDGMKGGYASRMKEQAKADKEFADSLGERKLADESTEEGRKKRAEQLKDNITAIAANTADGTNGAGLASARRELLDASNSLSSIEQEKEALVSKQRQKIAFFEERLASATTEEDRSRLKNNIKENKEAIKEIEKEYEKDLLNAVREKAAKQKKLDAANAAITQEAEAKYMYNRQLDLIDRRKRQRDRWTKFGRPILGTGAGAGVGAGVGALGTSALAIGVGAGVGAGVGLVSGVAARAYGENYGARVSELEKIYGRNGTKKVKEKKKKDQFKDLGNVLKEEGIIPEEKKE